MKIKKEKLEEVVRDLTRVLEAIFLEREKYRDILGEIHEEYAKSAQNLVDYTAFRKFDLRNIQKKLRNLGLTRFANAEGHILASLVNTLYILQRLIENNTDDIPRSNLSIKKGKRLLI